MMKCSIESCVWVAGIVGVFATTTIIVPDAALACTNFLVTPGATVDGSALITYAADSHTLYGELYYTAARDHESAAVRDVVDWDSGEFLGTIPEIPHTYSVVGNMNEHQLAIGETTFGGRAELRDLDGKIDYGSLMYIALERAKTAREAIGVMTSLVGTHGYYSKGESFSISDKNEVWLLEMIGRGRGNKGAIWVARQIPDGYVSAHANQARIRQLDGQSLASADVISFARERGYFNGEDDDFSFADAYAPLDFSALRISEARVWSFFRRIAPSMDILPDWVMGNPKATPLPLWVKPDEKLSAGRVMALMRDHFNDSPMDLHGDVGAGPYDLPYRWRPLYWYLDGVKYFNERAISTQQTGFSFVAQSRKSLPDPIGGILWFGVDDTNTTAYVPMYAGIGAAPAPFAVGTADFETFSWDSAFWTFNFVSNYAYGRYRDMSRDIGLVQSELEQSFIDAVPTVDEAAAKLHKSSDKEAREYLTQFSNEAAVYTLKRWQQLGQSLVVRYLDGNVRDRTGKVTHPAYPESWYRRIVEDTGERYRYNKIVGEFGYYTSREELGVQAANVPADFNFAKEKLWLIPGTAKCGQEPQCCLEARAQGEDLVVDIVRKPPTEVEAEHRRRCGEPAMLIRVPRSEEGDVILVYSTTRPSE